MRPNRIGSFAGIALFIVTLASGLAAEQSAPRTAATETVTAESIVYVTKTGAKYHTATCRHLSRSKIAMKLGEASEKYGGCSVCKPPQLPTPVPTPAKTAAVSAKPTAPRSSAAARRCAAIIKKGTQCARTASAGKTYCWQHGGD
jgi:hypothetical protein